MDKEILFFPLLLACHVHRLGSNSPVQCLDTYLIKMIGEMLDFVWCSIEYEVESEPHEAITTPKGSIINTINWYDANNIEKKAKKWVKEGFSETASINHLKLIRIHLAARLLWFDQNLKIQQSLTDGFLFPTENNHLIRLLFRIKDLNNLVDPSSNTSVPPAVKLCFYFQSAERPSVNSAYFPPPQVWHNRIWYIGCKEVPTLLDICDAMIESSTERKQILLIKEQKKRSKIERRKERHRKFGERVNAFLSSK